MCIYIIKKYFKILENYIFSSIMSIYYEIPRDKIKKYITYKNKIKYIKKINFFENDIDQIITDFLIGNYKIIKIFSYKYHIIKDFFYSDFIDDIFLYKKRVINLKFQEEINKYVIDFAFIVILLYPNPLVLTLTSVNNNEITTINSNTISYKILKYKYDFINQHLSNFTLNDFHNFIRLMNIFKREDFNIFYEYILENSENFSSNIFIKNIKIE